jgi:hypothetical protein
VIDSPKEMYWKNSPYKNMDPRLNTLACCRQAGMIQTDIVRKVNNKKKVNGVISTERALFVKNIIR